MYTGRLGANPTPLHSDTSTYVHLNFSCDLDSIYLNNLKPNLDVAITVQV